MIDLVCLRSFVHVCERGTVSAAASDLGYTAPAVSQHIARLERELDTALFDRVGGRLRPNSAGTGLLDLAASMLGLAERCHEITATPRDRPHVTIAAFASAISGIVAPALPSLAHYRISVSDMDDDEALRQLRLGQVDVALIQHYDLADFAEDARLTYREVARDQLLLVLPPDEPATRRLRDLGGSGFLLNGDGTQCTSTVLALLRRARVEPAVRGSLDDNHALLALVAAGLGACIVPALVLTEARRDLGLTVSNQRVDAVRTIVAVTRRSGDRSHGEVVERLTQPQVVGRPARALRPSASGRSRPASRRPVADVVSEQRG